MQLTTQKTAINKTECPVLYLNPEKPIKNFLFLHVVPLFRRVGMILGDLVWDLH